MKPALDPSVDYKALVARGYDSCADRYARARTREAPRELDLLHARLAPGSRVLDIGCGAGVPVTRALADRYRVLGVDLSAEQVKLARANVPRAEIAQADVMSIAIEPGSLDAAIGFYALFHLPRHEHAELFARLARWLRPGGLLLLTVARHSEAGYTEDHFFGETMYWSNWSSDEYRVLLGESGFEITASGIVGHGYELAPPERHPYLLAERRGVASGSRPGSAR